MKAKLGAVLIDKSLIDEAFSEVLSLQLDLRYFKNASELSQSFLTGPRSVRLCILDGSKRDLALQLNYLSSFPDSVKTLIVSEENDADRINELSYLGASDFLFRPFKIGELLFRCEKLLKVDDEFSLLPNTVEGLRIPELTIKERKLLAVFLLATRSQISREFLFEHVWKSVAVNRKTLDVHLFNLRRKLRAFGFDVLYRNDYYSLQRLSVPPNRFETGHAPVAL